MQMKKTVKALAVSASALALFACGSDSSSSAARETDSSSSIEAVSSSSAETENSFDKANLMKNMNLGTRFGTQLWLSAGDDGLYSLWFLDSASAETSYGTAVVKTDLSTGEIVFDTQSGYLFATNNAKGDSVLAWLKKGIRFEFAMEDSTLMVSIDGEDPVEVKRATRVIDDEYVSKADELKEKRLEWSNGDSSSVYLFYKDGEYVRLAKNDSAEVFEAGYYDVQRQHLLTVPVHFSGQVSILTSYTLKKQGDGYVFDNQISAKDYEASALTVDYPSKEDLAASIWTSKSNDTLKWTLQFNGDSYSALARTGMGDETLKFRRIGEWDVFGDYLVLALDSCSADSQVRCASVEKGRVDEMKSDSFDFDNMDEKSKYALPKSWKAVVEE